MGWHLGLGVGVDAGDGEGAVDLPGERVRHVRRGVPRRARRYQRNRQKGSLEKRIAILGESSRIKTKTQTKNML